MRKIVSLILTSAVVVSGSIGVAKDSVAREWRIPVGVYAGLSGFGVKTGFEWRWFGVYGTAASSFDLTVKNVDKKIGAINEVLSDIGDGFSVSGIDVGISTRDYGVDLRVRPFQGSFHVDIGYHYYNYSILANINKVGVNLDTLLNDSDGGFADGGDDIMSELKLPETISASVKGKLSLFKGWKPYFGFGWDWNLLAQLHLSLDVGVIYVGKYKLGTNIDLSDFEKPVTEAVNDALNDLIERKKAEAAEKIREESRNREESRGADEKTADYKEEVPDFEDFIANREFIMDKLSEYLDEKELEKVQNVITDLGITDDSQELNTDQILSVSNEASKELLSMVQDTVKEKIDLGSLENFLNKIRLFPMIKIGLTYKF